ncbi:MAG: hypothetical protein ABSE84_11875 [Isosphaeraceae bacterium]
MMDSRGEESILDDLLIRWEELNDQGRPVTIEDLCVEHPGLVKELRRRVEALRAMSPLLNQPTTSWGGGGKSRRSRRHWFRQRRDRPHASRPSVTWSSTPRGGWARFSWRSART